MPLFHIKIYPHIAPPTRSLLSINHSVRNLSSLNQPLSKKSIECAPEENGQRFRHVFICYGASASGFQYCRPILSLDGTHLKSKYKGVLLTATATDAHESLFPLAYAVVSNENDDNWLWFNRLLRNVIMEHAPSFLDPQALTFVSDRQKGLLEALGIVFPQSPNGYCLRHLYENMWKEFKHPELKTFLWDCKEARRGTDGEVIEVQQERQRQDY